MSTRKHGIKAGDLIPAWFIGSPVTLVLAAGLHFAMPVSAAVAIGVAAGFAAGLALLSALRRG